MAITKMLHISSGTALKGALEYIFDIEHDEKKTDGGRWIGGNAGGTPAQAYRRMLETKQITGKESGRQGYHFILSFAKGETTPDIAYAITQDFCSEYLGDAYDHAFVIHTDKEHLHGHVIFNSVSAEGRKYHYKKGDWQKEIQPIVNRLCREYGLSEIRLENPEKEMDADIGSNNEAVDIPAEATPVNSIPGTNGKVNRPETDPAQDPPKHQTHDAKPDRTMTWKVINREDIDHAIESAESYEEFLQQLRSMGYQIREGYSKKRNEPYIAIRTEGMERSRRTYQLGKDYTVPNLKKRITSRDYIMQVRQDLIDHPAKQPLKGTLIKSYSPAFIRIQRMYLIRIGRAYRTYYRYTKPYPQAWKYKKDLIDMQKLIDRYNFLHRNHITDESGLNSFAEKLEAEKQSLTFERNRLYRKKDRLVESNASAEEIASVRSDIRTYTDRIREIEKEQSMCRDIQADGKKERQKDLTDEMQIDAVKRNKMQNDTEKCDKQWKDVDNPNKS